MTYAQGGITARGLLVAVLALAASFAGAAPRSVSVTYGVFMNGIAIGEVSERLAIEGQTYRITSDTRPTGLANLIQRKPLRFESHGQLTRAGLQPVRFEARRTAGEPPQIAAHFDWRRSELVLTREGRSETLKLPAGTQDRLSIMYQFMFASLDTGPRIEFAMTNGRKLDRYRYSIAREVEIDTPMGRMTTVHLVKERDPGDTAAEIWLSPQHGYLAVRMIIVERSGVRFEQLIRSADVRG
jgi:hypothetical protein